MVYSSALESLSEEMLDSDEVERQWLEVCVKYPGLQEKHSVLYPVQRDTIQALLNGFHVATVVQTGVHRLKEQ